VEALRYKLEGSGIDSPSLSLEFFTELILQLHYDPGVDLASNRNKYQEYFLGCIGVPCVGRTTLPPTCPDFLEILNPQGKRLRPVQGLLYFLQESDVIFILVYLLLLFDISVLILSF
jgi:hypothetical protein